MISSNEKISFIIEYMNAYEEKIKMANKYGLFDSAKMFELFAIEVCRLWFGQNFTNLNTEKSTYPFVDLLSSDMQLFVQVSTAEDVPRKIKTTLENIRDTKDERFSVINKVIFFVLTNDSLEKVQDYNGDKQIGSILFTKNDNLITTKDVINKAKSDTTFLNDLYGVLKLEFERFNECVEKLNEAIRFSKSVGLKNIIGLINGEYEIDRSALVRKIKKDNEKFVTILGNAGSGKSALCKKILEEEDIILYARAESFVEATDINEIWKCDVKMVLEYLNGKRIVFFIDALEFIADSSDTKFERLQHLYEIVRDYENAYILASCRTSDKSAFIKLESNFDIKPYEIEDLTTELVTIGEKYPIIKKMYEMKSYIDLLRSPFYINLIVSRTLDIDNISDESSFREYIWKNIICLQETSKKHKITYTQAAEVIKKIVFERAKSFSLGIPEEKVDSNVVKALISEDIVYRLEDKGYIRLKYDIFEDICFEHYFDGKFD